MRSTFSRCRIGRRRAERVCQGSASLEQHFALVVEREPPFALLRELFPLGRDFEQLRVRLVAQVLGQHAAFFRITTIGKTFLHLYPADVKTVTQLGYGVVKRLPTN